MRDAALIWLIARVAFGPGRVTKFQQRGIFMDWYVATVRPQSEGKAAGDLAVAGMAVYFPVCCVEVWNERRRVKTIRKFPLFSGYMFIGADGALDMRAVNASENVTGILSVDGAFRKVAGAEVEAIMAAQREGAFDRKYEKKNKVFAINDAVKVKNGPWAGWHSKVTSVKGKALVKIMLALFNTEKEVEISVDDIEKAA
jgi:transcription antitermination factor NusG